MALPLKPFIMFSTKKSKPKIIGLSKQQQRRFHLLHEQMGTLTKELEPFARNRAAIDLRGEMHPKVVKRFNEELEAKVQTLAIKIEAFFKKISNDSGGLRLIARYTKLHTNSYAEINKEQTKLEIQLLERNRDAKVDLLKIEIAQLSQKIDAIQRQLDAHRQGLGNILPEKPKLKTTLSHILVIGLISCLEIPINITAIRALGEFQIWGDILGGLGLGATFGLITHYVGYAIARKNSIVFFSLTGALILLIIITIFLRIGASTQWYVGLIQIPLAVINIVKAYYYTKTVYRDDAQKDFIKKNHKLEKSQMNLSSLEKEMQKTQADTCVEIHQTQYKALHKASKVRFKNIQVSDTEIKATKETLSTYQAMMIEELLQHQELAKTIYNSIVGDNK